MKNLMILAQADEGAGANGITAEKLDQTQGTSTVTTEPGQPPAQQTPTRNPKPQMTTWLFMGLMFVMLYFIMFRGPRKKQRQHTQMIQSLSRNDRVQTVGGIIGTILDVKDNEITLKIDEANNTKIKVTPGSIGKKINKDQG